MWTYRLISGCAALAFAQPINAAVMWHTIQTGGYCSPESGCYPPSPFDSSLGILRSVEVQSDVGYSGTYYYNNFSDIDDVLIFRGNGDWYNWDAEGHFADEYEFVLPAGTYGTFNIGFGGSDHHFETGGLSSYSDPNNFDQYSYNAEVDFSYFGWTESNPGTTFLTPYDSDYNFGTNASLTLTYHYTTGSVPEPNSWVLLLSGFGLIGAAMRYRHKQYVSVARASLPARSPQFSGLYRATTYLRLTTQLRSLSEPVFDPKCGHSRS